MIRSRLDHSGELPCRRANAAKVLISVFFIVFISVVVTCFDMLEPDRRRGEGLVGEGRADQVSPVAPGPDRQVRPTFCPATGRVCVVFCVVLCCVNLALGQKDAGACAQTHTSSPETTGVLLLKVCVRVKVSVFLSLCCLVGLCK